MTSSSVVHIWTDVDLLDAQLSEPEAELARLLPFPRPGGGLHVATPEHQHVGILRDIHPKVVLIGLAQRGLTPNMFSAPVPTFPAIRLTTLIGIATE